MKKSKIIILGGGPVGLWLGLGLISKGFSVTIIEKSKIFCDTEKNIISPYFLCFEERFYALSLKTKNFLYAIEQKLKNKGIEGEFLKGNIDIKRVLLMKENHRSSILLEEKDQTFGFMMSHKDLVFHGLKWAMGAIKQKKLTFYDENIVENIVYNSEEKKWTLFLHHNKELQGDFLFSAMGLLDQKNPLRNLMNISYTTWDYHQKALVIPIKFYKKDLFVEYFYHNGVLALLPIGEEKAMVISMGYSANFQGDYKEKIKNIIRTIMQSKDFFPYNHGDFSFISSGQVFPLSFSLSQNLVYPGGMLLGSSAANIHPMAGYGLNQHFSILEDLLNMMDDGFFQYSNLHDLGLKGKREYKNLGLFTTSLLYSFGNTAFPFSQKKLWSSICLTLNKSPFLLEWLKKKGQGY